MQCPSCEGTDINAVVDVVHVFSQSFDGDDIVWDFTQEDEGDEVTFVCQSCSHEWRGLTSDLDN